MFDFICDRDRVDIDGLNNIHFLKCGVFCYIFKHEIINKNLQKKKVEIFSSFLQKRKSRSLCKTLYSPRSLILSGLLPGGCEFLKSIHVVVIVYNPNIKSLL